MASVILLAAEAAAAETVAADAAASASSTCCDWNGVLSDDRIAEAHRAASAAAASEAEAACTADERKLESAGSAQGASTKMWLETKWVQTVPSRSRTFHDDCTP